MSISDKDLQEAYKRSQQSQTLSEDVRQAVLQHNRIHNNTVDNKWGQSVGKLLTYFDTSILKLSAVAFALVALFATYYIGQQHTQFVSQDNMTDLTVNIVHYHGFEDEGKNFKTDNRRAKFKAYTEHYYANQSLAEAVSVQGATVQENSGNWLLVNCQDERVVVSQSLLSSLSTQKRIEGDIKVGTQVSLAFDRQGRILSIRSSAKPLVC